MIIKVCGMREPDNIRDVEMLGIDWIGFIFYPKSPRFVRDQAIAKTDSVKRVGVFVNASHEQIMETATSFGLDYLQLHGNESPDDCYALQKRGYAVIKAISIYSAEDLEQTKEYEGRVDYFLFDTKCSGYGGSGQQFDWDILTTYTGNTPFLLSGGINPGSSAAIRKFRHPLFAGIDLNSGFESEPGLKDTEKLKDFIETIKTTAI
ncbi:phosphoribosylanthranilate isomerase [Parabacteroides bouchesdurhonensis]|uniref:phosphoribosylanthranilate isomerase n=1 Tax=Parabacteroides bouchesdurhonensis TaxID=1936995 RepID=UPI000C857E6A|nr:phosphoribosylanthranilate isomerase [Parabacteroides bouchesdurhonensis]